MDANEYQFETEKTAVYRKAIVDFLEPIYDAIPPGSTEAFKRYDEVVVLLQRWYTILGLAGEAGEVANKAKKWVRDGVFTDISKELEDVQWYNAQAMMRIGVVLGLAMRNNLKRLSSRLARGVIQGSGDDR